MSTHRHHLRGHVPATALLLLAAVVLTGCGEAPTTEAHTPSSASSSVQTPSAAQTIPAGQSLVHDSTPEEQRQADIAVVRQFHPEATDEQALEYIATSQAATQLNTVLDADHSDVLAYAETGPGLLHTMTVHLKGADPAVLALIEAAALPRVTVDTRAKYSSNDVAAVVAAASDPFNASMDGPVQASSAGYDWDTDSVLVELQLWPGRSFVDVVASAPALVSVPGVVDVDGKPARVAVGYVETTGMQLD